MSEWIDRVSSHAVTKRLVAIKTLLDQLDTVGPLTPEKTAAVERLKQVRRHISLTLTAIDPALVPMATLNGLDNTLQSVLAECTTFQSNQNVGQLANANAHADQALLQLATLPLFPGVKELQGLAASVTSLRRSVSQYHRYVDSERDGLKAPIAQAKQRLAALEAAVTAEKARVDSVVADFQKQFSEAQESRLREYAEETKTRRETFEKHEEENFELFGASQEDRDGRFKEVLEGARASSAALLLGIEAHRDRAQELLFVIANTGMVGGYQQVANTKRQAAKVWQWIAAGSVPWPH